jgi:hypothetical protein
MLQQFNIPQLEEYDQEGRIHFQQDGAPPITSEKCATTSSSVSQVGGLVDGADSMATSFPRPHTPQIYFLVGIC